MTIAANGKPALLCVTPHFGNAVPPGGPAALLAYLHHNDCRDFAFVDFRTWLPHRCRTFNEMGAFAETFVLDVPELPIVLKMLKAFRDGEKLIVQDRDDIFDNYCLKRLLDPKFVHQYLVTLERFFATAWRQYSHVKFVGFTTWTTNYLSTLIAAAQLKRANRNVYVVAGGPQVTESRNSALLGLEAMLFDAVVCGEGEQALLDLYREFAANGGNPGSAYIPGVMKQSRCQTGNEPHCRKPLNLKTLPPPCFDEINLSSYGGWREHGMLPYQLSRGCTNRCSFCSEWVFWQRFRRARPEYCVEQITELQQKYKLRHISFTDSLLNPVGGRVEMFAEALLGSEITVTWGGFMRAQMTPEAASLISRAGCTFAFVGVESLADETLDSMNKRRTGADNIMAIEAFANANISVEVGLITGFPGDSRESFEETVRGVMRLQSRFPGRVRVSAEPFRPTPNQPIYDEMRDCGLEPVLWDDEILDLEPRFRDITSQIYCSVEGSNQGVNRLGALSYLGKVIKAAPKPSSDDFVVGWGRPEWVNFESESVRFRPFAGETLRGWCSSRALHCDGSVRFLILSNNEARQLQALLRNVGFGDNPFENTAFAKAWDSLADVHAIPGSIHPEKSVPHRFQNSLHSKDLLIASPFWTARIIDGGDDGLLIHNLHDLTNTYRTSPALAPILRALVDKPKSLADITRETLAENAGLDRDDVVRALDFAHELGVFSLV